LSSLVKGVGAMGRRPSSDESSSPVHTAIPPVLHCIVASTRELSSDLCPSFSHLANEGFNLESFFGADRLMIEGRFQVLMVSLSTLLWRARADELSNSHPIQGSLGMNKLNEVSVFPLRPWSTSM
jgi:hypothetical protein